MAVTSVTVRSPADAQGMPDTIKRPAVTFIWAGGTGPWDAEITWDDDAAFGNANGNRQIVTQTGITPIAETTIAPTADLGNTSDGRQWYIKAKVTDQADSGFAQDADNDFTYFDPKLKNRYLYLLGNVGVSITPIDAPIPSQIISIDATGGTFTVSFDGVGPSSSIGYDDTQGNVKAAIEGLSNVTTVTVTKLQPQQWLVRLDDVSPTTIPAFTINTGSLTGGGATGSAVEYIDDADIWGTSKGGTVAPDGNARNQNRHLYLLANVGVGFHPYDEPISGWGSGIGGTQGPDGVARNFHRYLYQLANVTTTQPCPFVFSLSTTTAKQGEAIVISGQGLTSATSPTTNAWGAEVRLYATQDLGGSYVVMPITGYTAGETVDTITATVPNGATSGFVAVVHTVTPTCTGSNFKGLTVIELEADRQAGWWVEVWNLRNSTGVVSPLPDVVEAGFEHVANDIGRGYIVLAGDHPDIADIVDRTASPPVQRLVKVYLHGRFAYAFIPTDIEEEYDEDGARLARIYGEGQEGILRWGRVLWRDYPSQPTRASSWIYGSEADALGWGDMEPDSAVENGGAEDAQISPWQTVGTATLYAGTAERHSGSYSLEVTPTAASSGTQTQFTVQNSKTVFIDLWLKDSTASGETVTVRVLDDADTVVATTSPTLATTWTQTTLSFTPSSSYAARLQIIYAGATPHKFYVDDVAAYVDVAGSIATARASYELNRTYKADGLHSMKIDADAGGDVTFNGVVCYFSVAPNQEYRVSLSLTGPTSSVARVGLRLGGILDEADVTFTGLGTWQTVTLTGTAGPNESVGRFAISSRNAAATTFYVDAITAYPGQEAKTAGAIVLDVLAAMQTRGTLPFLQATFDASVDSNLQAWPETLSMALQAEWTMWDVCEKLIGLGYDIEMVPTNWRAGGNTGWDLNIFNPGTAGTDWTARSDAPALLPGDAVTTADPSSAPQASTIVYGEGASGVWTLTSSDPTVVTALERREDFLRNTTLDATTLFRVTSTRLSVVATRGEQFTADLNDYGDPLPYFDFTPHDRMRAHLPATDRTQVADDTYRIAAVTARLTGTGRYQEYQVDFGRYRLHVKRLSDLLLGRILGRQTAENYQPGTGSVSGGGSSTSASPGGGLAVVSESATTTTHNHTWAEMVPAAAGGDLAGIYPDPSVAQLRGRPVATTAPSNGQVLTWDNTAGWWKPATPSGGGGSGGAILPLDIEPSSPPSANDEFSGSSLDGKWTQITTAAGTTATVANGWVTVEPSATGTGSTSSRGIFGYRQAVPGSGDFTVSAKIVNISGEAALDDGRAGLILGIDGAKGHWLGSQSSARRLIDYGGITTYSRTNQASAFDGTNTLLFGNFPMMVVWVQFRWIHSTTTLEYWYSANGVAWDKLGSRGSLSRPVDMGFGIYANSADIRADHSLAVDWFRVTSA